MPWLSWVLLIIKHGPQVALLLREILKLINDLGDDGAKTKVEAIRSAKMPRSDMRAALGKLKEELVATGESQH